MRYLNERRSAIVLSENNVMIPYFLVRFAANVESDPSRKGLFLLQHLAQRRLHLCWRLETSVRKNENEQISAQYIAGKIPIQPSKQMTSSPSTREGKPRSKTKRHRYLEIAHTFCQVSHTLPWERPSS